MRTEKLVVESVELNKLLNGIFVIREMVVYINQLFRCILQNCQVVSSIFFSMLYKCTDFVLVKLKYGNRIRCYNARVLNLV